MKTDTKDARSETEEKMLKTIVFEYFVHLSATFDVVEMVLNWLHQLTNDLDVAFGVFATGHLAPQIIPPTQMEALLTQIKPRLPLGLSLTSHDLWLVYQEF